jgi:hypothetical protein
MVVVVVGAFFTFNVVVVEVMVVVVVGAVVVVVVGAVVVVDAAVVVVVVVSSPGGFFLPMPASPVGPERCVGVIRSTFAIFECASAVEAGKRKSKQISNARNRFIASPIGLLRRDR